MAARKTGIWKRVMGIRADLSDGFTYPYGKFKFNKNTRSAGIKRQIRNDKRSVKRTGMEEAKHDAEL